jgi:hypothetical protein
LEKKLSLDISVTDILNLEEFDKYKLHAASRTPDGWSPLDAYLISENEWKTWNQYYPGKDDFNREYIFSMMEFYPKPNTWLFGGIFKVIGRKKNYVIEEIDKYKKYSGRLLLNFNYKNRQRRLYLENYIDYITVSQIFEYKYSGEVFPGYDKINHDFCILENILKNNKSDWKTALENVKGIYLLTDKATGKSYVGAAYSDSGIWSRWQQYINTFHGWNNQMVSLVDKKGEKYIRNNFKFTILEIMYVSDDQKIKEREDYWKDKLMTREHGYNSN